MQITIKREDFKEWHRGKQTERKIGKQDRNTCTWEEDTRRRSREKQEKERMWIEQKICEDGDEKEEWQIRNIYGGWARGKYMQGWQLKRHAGRNIQWRTGETSWFGKSRLGRCMGREIQSKKWKGIIQKIHNMERDLQSMRQGKGEMEGRGKWKLGVGGQLQMVRGEGRSWEEVNTDMKVNARVKIQRDGSWEYGSPISPGK